MILIDAKLKRAWKKVNVYPNNIIGFLIFSHGRNDGKHSLEEITNKVHTYGCKMKWEE